MAACVSEKLTTTAEAEVTLRVRADVAERLAGYGDELAGFLIVARVTVVTDPKATEPQVEVRRTTWSKCERCWTFREDVVAAADGATLCGRCHAVVLARGTEATGAAPTGADSGA